MKSIYLMLIVIAAALNVSAQRNVDMSIRHFYKLGTGTFTAANEVTNGTHILFDGDEQYKINFGYIFINNAANAADSVMQSDTIKFRSFIGGGILHTGAGPGFYLPGGVAGGAQSGIITLQGYPMAIAPGDAFNGVSDALQVSLCDSIWIVSAAGSLNPAVEANRANDTICNNVIVDGWASGINNIEVDLDGNGLLVYPNPSASRDINIMYNFGVRTSKAIVTVVDVTGKVVYSKNIGTNLSGTQNIALHMGDITPGMYSVRLATDTKTVVEKICVK
ncbi:T9SS type A sorting domain-containing protein [Polluticoccus soli]|uniref:T9SS type A sorting domain-containing protein n=1 Tax=Polluticoccus soli TaxID=3034150 RepID=UPI0023E2983B|nr:T9SS type A sorting domain-containing protein [Flavipsychrobacter sp. JY13-12]